jgi:hypothetical protein
MDVRIPAIPDDSPFCLNCLARLASGSLLARFADGFETRVGTCAACGDTSRMTYRFFSRTSQPTT